MKSNEPNHVVEVFRFVSFRPFIGHATWMQNLTSATTNRVLYPRVWRLKSRQNHEVGAIISKGDYHYHYYFLLLLSTTSKQIKSLLLQYTIESNWFWATLLLLNYSQIHSIYNYQTRTSFVQAISLTRNIWLIARSLFDPILLQISELQVDQFESDQIGLDLLLLFVATMTFINLLLLSLWL